MRFIRWLEEQITLAESHIAGFDSGVAVSFDGEDVTAIWRAEHVARLASLRETLARQLVQDRDSKL